MESECVASVRCEMNDDNLTNDGQSSPSSESTQTTVYEGANTFSTKEGGSVDKCSDEKEVGIL